MKDDNHRNLNSGESDDKRNHHAGHGWMMALCLGVPLLAILAVWFSGARIAVADLLLLLLCPLVMGVMMWAMERRHGDSKERSEITSRKPGTVKKRTANHESSETFSTWEA